MRITAALTGTLGPLVESELKAAEQAATRGVRDAGEGLQAEYRRQVDNAGLGTRVARAWRLQRFPKGGASMGAAALVFTKAPDIVAGFSAGKPIRARRGQYLAIPTEAVIRRGGTQLNPRDFEEAGIPLRFVPPKGRRLALLVADNFTATRSGRFRAATARRLKSGRGLATVVMFVLVRQVSLRKRLDVDGPHRRWAARLPGLVVRHWNSLRP